MVRISTWSASQQHINGTQPPHPYAIAVTKAHTLARINKINELTRKHCQSSHPPCRSLGHVPPSQSLKNQTKTKTTTQTKRKQTIHASWWKRQLAHNKHSTSSRESEFMWHVNLDRVRTERSFQNSNFSHTFAILWHGKATWRYATLPHIW